MSMYSVNGLMYGAGFLPAEAPTLSHGDAIAVEDRVRVEVDLTPYDFEEGEHITHHYDRAVLGYTVNTEYGRPFLTPTFLQVAPDAIQAKHGSFFWIGDDLYQITIDHDTESPWCHKLSVVQPRPPRLDPNGSYRVRTIILDPPSNQEQVVDIEPITGAHWMATRGEPLSAEDTGSPPGTWYRVELLAPDEDSRTDRVLETYEVVAR